MLLNPFMVKQVWGNTDLELEADSGESFLVKDILVSNPSSNYMTVKIGKTVVGYFRVGGLLGSHQKLSQGSLRHSHSLTTSGSDGALTNDEALINAFGQEDSSVAVFSDDSSETEHADVVGFNPAVNPRFKSLLRLLRDAGIFKGFPVAEGQKLTITGVAQASAACIVLYERHSAGDLRENQPNGSGSSEYLFVNYGRVGSSISGTTDTQFDSVQSPSEFPDFPFGKEVPAKYEITIYGILGSDTVDDRGGGDDVETTYLKLVKERETLFDEDRNGLFHRGLTGNPADGTQIGQGLSLIGNFSDKDSKPPLFFQPALRFTAGEELGVYVSTVAGSSQASAGLSPAETEIGLIETIKKVG